MIKIKKKKIFSQILLVLGIILFICFISKLGTNALELIKQNFQLKYILVYAAISIFAHFPLVWRWQIILKAYGEKISFLTLLRQQVAGYTISYITPMSRMGGEPLRVYMLKKECNVDYKTGTISVILDKYMEFLGTVMIGTIGLTIFLFTPIPLIFKIALILIVIFCVVILFLFYHRLKKEKGFFSNILRKLKLDKKWGNLHNHLIEIEIRMGKFFKEHKKEFFLSFLFYCLSGAIFIVEFKYLLLSFGITASIPEIVLIVTIVGLTNFVPVPASLGFLEIGQSGLFQILRGDSSIGLALSLLMRVKYLVLVSIGFLLIIHFSGKEVLKNYKKVKVEI